MLWIVQTVLGCCKGPGHRKQVLQNSPYIELIIFNLTHQFNLCDLQKLNAVR
jgi:hypothetical protein